MPDYDADPLWDDKSGAMVPLSRLPISDSLKQRLTTWTQRWDDAATREYETGVDQPPDPFHEREKGDLWMALREELGREYEVGVAVASTGRDTRVHVVWEPRGQPELPTWHKRSD